MGVRDFGRDAIAWGRFDDFTLRCLLPYAFTFTTPRGVSFLVGWFGFYIMLDFGRLT